MKKVNVTTRETNHPWQVRYKGQASESWKSFRTEKEADEFMAKFKMYEITLPGFQGDSDETDHLVKWILADHVPVVTVEEIDLRVDCESEDYVLE